MNFDEKLAAALGEFFEEHTCELMSVEKKHRFSLSYRLWERKVLWDIKKKRTGHWSLRKVKITFAAAAVCASMFIGVTAYAVISIGRFGFVDKVEYSQLFIEKLHSDKTSIEEYYGLPEDSGWVLDEYEIYDTTTMLCYSNGEKYATFSQTIIVSKKIGNVNTEKADIEPISVHEESDGFLMDFGEKGCLVYWIYDGYLFSLFCNLDKTSSVDLAHSMKILDFEKII